jgi:hypothetical protein
MYVLAWALACRAMLLRYKAQLLVRFASFLLHSTSIQRSILGSSWTCFYLVDSSPPVLLVDTSGLVFVSDISSTFVSSPCSIHPSSSHTLRKLQTEFSLHCVPPRRTSVSSHRTSTLRPCLHGWLTTPPAPLASARAHEDYHRWGRPGTTWIRRQNSGFITKGR